jgi:hypothetical protein
MIFYFFILNFGQTHTRTHAHTHTHTFMTSDPPDLSALPFRRTDVHRYTRRPSEETRRRSRHCRRPAPGKILPSTILARFALSSLYSVAINCLSHQAVVSATCRHSMVLFLAATNSGINAILQNWGAINRLIAKFPGSSIYSRLKF